MLKPHSFLVTVSIERHCDKNLLSGAYCFINSCLRFGRRACFIILCVCGTLECYCMLCSMRFNDEQICWKEIVGYQVSWPVTSAISGINEIHAMVILGFPCGHWCNDSPVYAIKQLLNWESGLSACFGNFSGLRSVCERYWRPWFFHSAIWEA